MAVPEQTPYKEFTANGVTKIFPLEFDVLEQDHLIVLVNDLEPTVGSWSLDAQNDTVVFALPPANGANIKIRRDTPLSRSTDYESYNNSFRPKPVNKDFDRIWLKLQELGYADSVLFSRLAKEILDRIVGDKNLQSQIYNIKKQLEENTIDIDELVKGLSKEIKDRINGDKILKDFILAIIDEAIVEGTVNALAITHVDSKEDLNNITNVWDGRTVYVKNIANYQYNAISKEWKPLNSIAEYILDASGSTQQSINDSIKNKSLGYCNLLEYIPKKYHASLKTLISSGSLDIDINDYFEECFNDAKNKKMDVMVPFGYYFLRRTLRPPSDIRVIGLAFPFLMKHVVMSDTVMVSVDNADQPTYHLDGFHINGARSSNLTGLHIGGCRNSVFKNIVITECIEHGVLVYPTNAESGDVENIELSHIWTVVSGGVTFKTNSNIARGNITDGTIANCQLPTGDLTTKTSYPVTLQASSGKLIFGLKFSRIFTQTTDDTHMVVVPNGGAIYGCSFNDFTGESWSLAGLPYISAYTLYIFNGDFFNNTFTNFYTIGMQGNGINLSAGNVDNKFINLTFNDNKPIGQDNKWLAIQKGASRNIFENVTTRYALDAKLPNNAATRIFQGSGGKITDLDGTTVMNGCHISSNINSLIKRSRIFELNPAIPQQLLNYPVEGCAFENRDNNLLMTVPAGSQVFELVIPFSPLGSFVSKKVACMFKWVRPSTLNGMLISVELCGVVIQAEEININQDAVVLFNTDYLAANSVLKIKFSGNRTSVTSILIKDIVISQGSVSPYLPNFIKHYIEA